MPNLMYRRYRKEEELGQQRLKYFKATVFSNVTLFAGLLIFARVRKTFLKSITYTHSTKSLQMRTFTLFGTRLINGIKPGDLEVQEVVDKAGKVARRAIVRNKALFSGYSHFELPIQSAWTNKEIFDEWVRWGQAQGQK